jgi:UDP-N-acetylmuramoyl-tripeptide--D-alanyl-D-alanine ligase
MGAALDVLMDVGSNLRKVAVLGDMLELGNREIDGHKEIGVRVADHDIDLLITVGRRARLIAAAASDMGMADDRIICVDHNQDAFHEIKERIKPGDVILVKGSRGMGMEEIIADVQNLPPVIEGGK